MKKSTKYRDYRRFAVTLAKKSGDFLYKSFGKIKKIEEKGFRDYVTDVDKKSEKIIINAISKNFPDHSILAEEKGRVDKKSDYLWVIDPLDGTHNYIAQIPIYGVSIALCLNKEVIVGAVYFPCLKEIYEAESGGGAYLNGKRIHVSNKSLKDSFIFFDSILQDKEIREIKDTRTISRKIGESRILGCLSFQLAYIANGRAEGAESQTGKAWDYAAASLIIQEAGGKVTNLKGERFTIEDRCVVATNEKIHDQLLKLLNK